MSCGLGVTLQHTWLVGAQKTADGLMAWDLDHLEDDLVAALDGTCDSVTVDVC